MPRKILLPMVVALLSLSLMAEGGFARKSETDQVIQFFQWKVSQDPEDCFNYDRLGTAYIQKARETGDIAYFDLAAKALELSVPAVKSRLLRARLQLREKLTRYFKRKGDDAFAYM